MTELTELEEAMRSLKKDNVEKKRLVSELENEKKYMEERNRFLIEKLKQAGVLYEESGRRLADFVNENVKPLKAKLAEFETLSQKTKEYEKSIGIALKRVNDFDIVIGNFKNEMIKNSEKQAEITAKLGEIKKAQAEIAKRISTVQTFGSEELADKVEEIKAKFGEDTRKIEDEFGILRLGVSSAIENFKKEFERQANALRNEMEKVDIKKAKELGDALARTTEELNKTKADFAKSIVSIEKEIENLDVEKTRELSKSIEVSSANLERKFADLSSDIEKRIISAESDLNGFRIELEKTLGKAKVETRDFVASKSKEFDSLLAELKEKMNAQVQASVTEWNKNLGSLRSDLIDTKKEVETLIGVINRKVEIGEERREKKLDASLAAIQTSLSKKIETATDEIYGHVDDINGNVDGAKEAFTKKVEMLSRMVENSETRRKKDIEKIIREFMAVKGQVDEKIKEVSGGIERFSKTADILHRQIVKDSLAGVQDRMKVIFEEMEKKFETVENGLIDKIASMESDFDEFDAGFQGTLASLRAETDKKIDSLKKEFERRDVSRDKEAGAFSKTLQKNIDGSFAALSGKLDNRIKAAEGEITSLSKTVDNFTVDLNERFDSIIQTKTKEFEKTVKSLVADMKSMEKDVNHAISEFKSDIEKREMQKKGEVDRVLKEFIAAKGKIDEKMLQIDKRISVFSEIRKELKKEIYKESLSGVQERVKDIVAGLEERFEASRDETGNKIGELIKGADARMRDTELNLNSFRVELEKTVGKLRADVDKITGKKTIEMDKVVTGLKRNFEEGVKVVNAELIEKFEVMKKEVASMKGELANNITSMRKEFEAGEAARAGKADKVGANLSKELKLKLDEFASAMNARTKANETGIRSLGVQLDKVVADLKEKFEDIIVDKTDTFETSMEEVVEKAGKARKDVENLAEKLKAKFLSEERGRRKETEKSLKELMVVKGGMARRMEEIDDGIANFSGVRDSLKSEVLKENSALIESKLSSFTDYKKHEITETKKSLKTETVELRLLLDRVVEKVGKLNDKIDAVKEDVYAVKKVRGLLVDNVKSLSQTMEANTDAKLRTFMKDTERDLRSHENILSARMAALEKKIGAVSDHASKTKREKEDQLDELLRHVES